MVVGETIENTQQYEGTIDKQFNAEHVADKIAMLLRGYRYDPNIKEYTNKIIIKKFNEQKQQVEKIEDEVEPMLNEQGVFDIQIEILGRISNINSSAYLTAAQIRSTRHGIAEVLWEKLRYNRVNYELNVVNLKGILFMVDDEIMLFLSRTEKGMFSKLLSKILGRKEQVNYTVAEQSKPGTAEKRGIFS